MIDRVVADVPIADAPQCAQGPCRDKGPRALPRRTLICSIGLLTVAALPTWMAGTPSMQNIIVIDGWILADTDLR
jgi:hypothetical protein